MHAIETTLSAPEVGRPLSAFFFQEKGFSELLNEPLKLDFINALMPADPENPQGGVTIFIAANIDWAERHFTRHGRAWLATLPATRGMAEYRDHCPRATRLTYRGAAPGNEAGMIEDLERLGYSPSQIEVFTRAAAAWWPKKKKEAAA